MGDVIKLHARASAGSRAANSVNKSADSPAACPFSERKIGSHHSAGIVSLSDHLRTASRVCPTSDAKASKESQRPTTSRKFEIMDVLIGHYVLKGKPNLSLDGKRPLGQSVRMADRENLSEYDRGFIARVRAARAQRFKSQQDFCTAVGIDQDSYKVFETIRVLPPEAYEQYCAAWGVTIPWLVTGKGPGPAVQPLPEKRARRPSAKKAVKLKKRA